MSEPKQMSAGECIRRNLDCYLCFQGKTFSATELDRFAEETAAHVKTYQHVYNSKLSESDLFKQLLKDKTSGELHDIGYTSTGRRYSNLRPKQCNYEELQEAFDKCGQPEASEADRLDYFLTRIAAKLYKFKRGKSPRVAIVDVNRGRPKRSVDALEKSCFIDAAAIFERHAACQPRGGTDGPFVRYIELCIKSVRGDLVGVKDKIRLYVL